MRCASCSTELPEGSLICGECGRAMSSTAPVKVKRHPEPEPEPEPEPVPEPEPEPESDAQTHDVEPERTGRGDTDQFDPFPWGLPSSASARPLDAPAAGAVVPAPSDPSHHGDRVVGDRYVLQFSTGESFSVTGTGLVGRNPSPEPGEYFDHSVTIADPGKSVSKTHLEFGQDGGAFWISDRLSGNGTLVREPEGNPKRCEPGRRYRVARGGRIDIGDQFFIVS